MSPNHKLQAPLANTPRTAAIDTAPVRTTPLPSLAGVAPKRQTEWLTPGEYVLRLTKAHDGTTRKGRAFFVIEAQVVECEQTDDTVKPVAVGFEASVMIMLDSDGADQRIRAFLEGVCTAEELAAIDDPERSAAEVARLTPRGPNGPLAGRLVHVSAANVTTRKGAPFTVVRWFRVDPAQAAAAQ